MPTGTTAVRPRASRDTMEHGRAVGDGGKQERQGEARSAMDACYAGPGSRVPASAPIEARAAECAAQYSSAANLEHNGAPKPLNSPAPQKDVTSKHETANPQIPAAPKPGKNQHNPQSPTVYPAAAPQTRGCSHRNTSKPRTRRRWEAQRQQSAPAAAPTGEATMEAAGKGAERTIRASRSRRKPAQNCGQQPAARLSVGRDAASRSLELASAPPHAELTLGGGAVWRRRCFGFLRLFWPCSLRQRRWPRSCPPVRRSSSAAWRRCQAPSPIKPASISRRPQAPSTTADHRNRIATPPRTHAAIDIGAGRFYLDGDSAAIIGALSPGTAALAIEKGAVILHILPGGAGQVFVIETPRGKLRADQPGIFEVEVAAGSGAVVVSAF